MRRRSLFTCASVAALVSALPAAAQDAAPAPAGAMDEDAQSGAERTTDGDIIVTARRREEALQDVPISVTAISGAQLAAQGTLNIQQLPIPSLNATAQGTNRKALGFAIRGQRTGEPQLLTDPPVGTYFAEVIQPRPFGFGNTLFDIASVQVLKGVQGTLFGRNVTGGAVLIEPNTPTDRFEGGLTGSIGNYDLRDLEGFINVPLGDVAAIRIAGKTRKRDGYVREIDTGQQQEDDNYDALRGSLRFEVGRLQSTTIVDWLKAEENGAGMIGTDYAVGRPGSGVTDANFFTRCGQPSATNGLTTIGSQQCASLGGVATPLIQQYQASIQRLRRNELTYDSGRGGRLDAINQPLFSDLENLGFTNKTVFELSDTLSLKNIAGYREIDFVRYQDLDGIPAFLINSIQQTFVKQYSEELQLQGSMLADRLNFTLGGYYFVEKGTERTAPSSQFPELTILGAIAAGAPLNPFTAPASLFVIDDTATAKATTYAFYAAGTFDFTETLSVAAGIRYTNDKREVTIIPLRSGQCTYDPDGAGPGPRLPNNACFRSNETTDDDITYDVTLQYEPSDAVTAYVSTRRGFRAGGFGLRGKSDAEFQPFKPETVQEYEFGVKNKFDLGFALLNTALAVFYQDYENVQKGVPIVANGAVITVTTNTTAQENYGGEFEANLNFDNGLTLTGFYSYVDANIKEFGDPSLVGSYALIGAPHHQAGLNANYRPVSFPEEAGELSFNANISYKSSQHLDDRDASADQRGYSLVNVAIDWDDIYRSGIGFGIFANNLFDKRYRVGVISLLDTVGIQASLFGEPLTYGARLKFKF